MREIKILTLSLRNFKGCETLTLDFGGQSASIYGDNATGKTTIYDALTWLLFGKDSRGRGDFEIKPLGPDNKVKDHAAVTSVEAALLTDGIETRLKKTYFEKWSTKRGSATETYDGNTSEYCVDEVPVKKYEFEQRVGSIVDEELFRVLTNVSWFCEGLDWKSRRKALFQVCEVPDDRLIMAENPQFSSLLDSAGALSLDDYKKKLTAQRKALNGARNTVPARLDEQRRIIDSLSTMDFEEVREQRSAKSAQMDQLTGELLKLDHGALLDSKRNDLIRLQNELSALVNENNAYRQSQTFPAEDKRPQMQKDLDRVQREMVRWSQLASNEKELIQSLNERIEKCRERWKEENEKQFDGAQCPTCGQDLPQAQMEAARGKFLQERERRKKEAVEQADLLKRDLGAAEARRERYIQDAVDAECEASRISDELSAYVPAAAPTIEDMPGYSDKLGELQGAILAAKAEIQDISSETSAIREEIGRKIQALRVEVDQLDRELGKAGTLEFAKARETALRQEAQRAAEEMEAIDRRLFLCEEFARFKVQFIESGINQKFGLARFRLFREQVNGGLDDCCEVMYDGVPYSSLNNGMRINIGVDVIRTISEHYGIRVPLVVDNAESVTRLLDAGTQVIRLVVSESDQELRCEYGA